MFYWIKKKLVQFKRWVILIIFGAAVVAAPLVIPPTIPDIALEKIQAKYEASDIKDKYRLEKTAFILDAVDENAIQSEVGNKNSDSFEPSLTLRKWDDEVNFKVKYKHGEKEKDQKVDIENKKIKWIGEKTEVHYYDIKKGELLHDKVLESDVFEVEVILLEKPATNLVEFDIETKGLAFYYQPELTQEEKDEGASRPENVIGSYAVYHESKQGDYSKMGLKNYRAGKAFHIYRPKIIDSAGTEVWGELNITDNLLTVEIPQEFLDNAVYPIRHAAGLTFGYTTLASTNGAISFNTESLRKGNIISYSGGAGTLDKITLALKTDTGSDTIDISAFLNIEDGGGSGSHSEVTKIEELEKSITTSYVWYDFTANNENIANNDYLLNAVGNNLSANYNLRFPHDTVGSDNYYSESVVDGYATLSNEDPWTYAASGSGRRYSIYCTYTSSGAARRMFIVD